MNDVDAQIGGRVRQRRKTLGITQRQLADALGVSYQQLQKYERGKNRIPASRLFVLTSILNVSATYFFDYRDRTQPDASPAVLGVSEDRPDSRQLNAAFVRLRSKALRRSVIAFVEAVADQHQWPVR